MWDYDQTSKSESLFWWDYETPEERKLHADMRGMLPPKVSIKQQDRQFLMIYAGLFLISAILLTVFIFQGPPKSTTIEGTTRAVTR